MHCKCGHEDWRHRGIQVPDKTSGYVARRLNCEFVDCSCEVFRVVTHEEGSRESSARSERPPVSESGAAGT